MVLVNGYLFFSAFIVHVEFDPEEMNLEQIRIDFLISFEKNIEQ